MSKKYLKNLTSPLTWRYVFLRDLDLSKEVLWVSVIQRAAELPAVKVEGQKKILLVGRVRNRLTRAGRSAELFFQPPTLIAGSSAAL